MPGLQYLTAFALPNFYFHATTATRFLRHNGLELGKRGLHRTCVEQSARSVGWVCLEERG